MPRRNPQKWTPNSASNQTSEARSAAARRDRMSSLLCRTCLWCRAKKVKCSGDRPGCISCTASNRECKYPEDARLSHRTTKADTRALQNEIFLLRQMNAGGQQLRDQVTEADPTNSNSHVGESHCPLGLESLGYGEYTGHLPENPQLNQAYVPIDISNRGSNALQSPVSENEAQQQGSYRKSRRRSRCATPRAEQGPSPQDVYAGTVTKDGQVQAYGVTSTLHEPTALRPASEEGNRPENDKEKDIRIQLVRDQLLSNAVIQRQRETSLHLTPQVKEKIDLDGVAPDVAFHLMNLHWNRQHYSYLLTYRPAIMDSLVNGGPYTNKLLLNAIYYSSSLYSDRIYLRADPSETSTLRGRFYRRFKELLVDEIDRPSIPTAVALLLCGASLVSHGEQSAGWVLCGTAYRMIIDLGCHLSMEEVQQPSNDKNHNPSRSTAIEFEIRKRLYWGAFMTDKFQSLYLGRAPALRSTDAHPPKDILDCYEELELWEPYKGLEATALESGQVPYQTQPAYAVSTFSSLLELAEIAGQVIDAFYSKECMKTPTEALQQMKAKIGHQLDEWAQNLPCHLHFNPDTCPTPPPHQIPPHAIYWTLKILLERPFLDTGHFNFVFDPAIQAIGEGKCTTGVLKIWGLVKAYKNTFTLRRAPYLLCYATYSAVLVILRQSQYDRANFSECVPFFWSALLDLQQGCNAGLKKPLNILKTLMKRLGADIPQLHVAANEIRSGSSLKNASEGGLGLPATGPTTTGLSSGATDFGLQERFPMSDSLPIADILESLELDLGNSEQWFDTMVGDEGGLMDDSMYGLFTA